MAVKLILSGEMSLERDITLTQAGKIAVFLDQEANPQEQQVLGSGTEGETPSFVASRVPMQQHRSLRELIDEAQATKNGQKVLVLGAYLAEQNGDGLFSPDEVKVLFPKAREVIPKNFSRDFLTAADAGWIEESLESEGRYFVTRKGETVLASGFSREVTKTPRSKPKTAKNGSASTENMRQEVLAISPVVPELEGYPTYHKLPTKGAKVLWILAYARANSVDSLTPREISYIAVRLRDKIASGDVNGLTVTAFKNVWISKDAAANYTLLYKGEEYLKDLKASDGKDKQ